MEYSNARSSQDTSDWRDLSFHMVIYEYFVKNTSLSPDLGTLIGYILFFVITWYLIIWSARFLFSLLWPVVIVVLVVLTFRFIATFEGSDFIDVFFQAVAVVADMVLAILGRTLEFGLSFLN